MDCPLTLITASQFSYNLNPHLFLTFSIPLLDKCLTPLFASPRIASFPIIKKSVRETEDGLRNLIILCIYICIIIHSDIFQQEDSRRPPPARSPPRPRHLRRLHLLLSSQLFPPQSLPPLRSQALRDLHLPSIRRQHLRVTPR